MVYFTSDLHIGHRNIVKYRSNINFNTQEEHDAFMLNKICELNKRDVLYILGDFIFDAKDKNFVKNTVEYLQKNAKCRIKLVMGNHDSLELYKLSTIHKNISAQNRIEIQLPLFSYKNIWVSHCPIIESEFRSRIGNIHGHLHKETLNNSKYFNVNIDVNDYEFVPHKVIMDYFKD